MKYAARITRLALGSMLGVLNQETFTVRSVGELMWGYNDSLFRLAKDVMPPENVVPHDLFGLFVGVSPILINSVDVSFNNALPRRKMEREPKDDSPLSPGATPSKRTPTSTTGTAGQNYRTGKGTNATALPEVPTARRTRQI